MKNYLQGGIFMRIGTYNMVNQIYGAKSTKKSSSVNGTNYASFKDEVSFSSLGKDMQVAKNALAGVSDVRESKISDLKAKVQSGTYNVSPEDFAKKLISAYEAQSI